jgi:CheY-like chemotaxis protein
MPMRVLIADDSSQTRLILSTLLRRRNHAVLEAVDGEQALELLRAEHPDLAIIDLIMPKSDGLEVCQAVRSEPSLRVTKIIVVSASDGRIQALASGADRFLSKPFLPDELYALIDEVMTTVPPPDA